MGTATPGRQACGDPEIERMTPMDETPEPQPKRLTRSHADTVIGGVAGGLGRYFGVDPILFRIGFVVLTFIGGVGVIAYLALLAFVPSDDPEATGGRSRAAALAGAIVLGLALVTFLDAPGPGLWFGPGLLIVAILAVAAVVLWRAIDRDAGGDPVRTLARVALFGLLAFAVACLAIGVGIAAALGGGVVIAALAVAAGIALIAAAFFGGARWLIVPALALVLPLAVVAAADIDLEGGVGDRDYRPASLTELRDRYEVGLGGLDVDLTDLDLPAGRTDLTVDVGIGDAIVWVPSNACVTSDVSVGAGATDILDRDQGGLDVDVKESVTPSAARPHLHIDADVGIGYVEIVREGFRPDWQDHDRGFRFDDADDEPARVYEGGLNCA
jgi:phage shock protein PspC (stress-responsive transcriptional regulator)